jgi:hypothetical protein
MLQSTIRHEMRRDDTRGATPFCLGLTAEPSATPEDQEAKLHFLDKG